MLKRLRNYFIGEYLQAEPDTLKQASVELVYNMVSISILCLSFLFFVYLSKGLHYQLIKNAFIITFFTCALFYIKYRKSIELVSQVLIAISWINNLINLYLFQDFNFFIALITVINIIFTFHTLGTRAGFIWSALHFVPVSLFFVLKMKGVSIKQGAPQYMPASELVVTLFLVFFLMVYLIYHYHRAYEQARASVRKSVEEMRKAKDMAEEMNRLKSSFLANMSHEIRTPINGILGISQIIEMESSDPDIRKYIALQKQSGKRLLDTITSILSLSRLEAAKEQLVLRVVDINHLLGENMEPLREMALARHLEFSVDLFTKPLLCLADETVLYQVFNNIIGNAIKFTEKGRVHVTTILTSHKSNQISFIVEDTGIGISEEFFPRLFTAFEQESSGQGRTHEGSGLGLSISKRYIELLGGEIVVTSKKGKGSKFVVHLPLYKAS